MVFTFDLTEVILIFYILDYFKMSDDKKDYFCLKEYNEISIYKHKHKDLFIVFDKIKFKNILKNFLNSDEFEKYRIKKKLKENKDFDFEICQNFARKNEDKFWKEYDDINEIHQEYKTLTLIENRFDYPFIFKWSDIKDL